MQKDPYNQRLLKALPKEITATTKASEPLPPLQYVSVTWISLWHSLRTIINFDLPGITFFFRITLNYT